MQLIPLSAGKFAKVDDSDYEWLMQWKWSFDGNYAVRNHYFPKEKNRHEKIFMHKLILGDKIGYGDHINRDMLDNTRSNLRKVTASQNSLNRKLFKNNSTGFRGVHRHGKKFQASIKGSDKLIHLGTFEKAVDAAMAYNAAAIIYHKEFSMLNKI